MLQGTKLMHIIAYVDYYRSVGGWCVFLGYSLVSLSCNKYKVVSRSSTKAEFRSLVVAMLEVMWSKKLLEELYIHLCSDFYYIVTT